MSARSSITWLNDTHSRLNLSCAARVMRPNSREALVSTVRAHSERGWHLISSGSRHAMGGQQFCARGSVLDLRSLARVLHFDDERGLIEVEAGMEWPELVEFLQSTRWSIVQKQTGADRLSIGGALSANIHGRGLALRPFVQDVEDFTLIDANGDSRLCSRTENADLFRHAIGGYGLFGCVASVRLRLMPRVCLRRRVSLVRAEALTAAFDERITDGATYGDWQFAIDDRSDDFLDLGVLSTYEPDDSGVLPERQRKLTAEDWCRLLLLAHTDKARGFAEYSEFYLRSDGHHYWSDTHQLGVYAEDYHRSIDAATCACVPGSEMITELYVPRERLAEFLASVRTHLRACAANVIYGTVRLIERDSETALPWARERWACIVFNLHVDHEPNAIAQAQVAFRGLIDCALACQGSYYLTYHRWATREQMLRAHPALPAFLDAKRRHDSVGVFQSDWFRHLHAP